MRKLIKKINPNEYLKLSTYAKKYSIVKRKIYRYVDDDLVDNVKIDGIPFIKDIHFPILERDNRESIVPSLSIDTSIVPTVTLKSGESTDNQVDNPIVPTVTLDKYIVPSVTIEENEKIELNNLLNKPESDTTISDYKRIEELKNKY